MIPPVAATTPMRNFCVTLISPDLYRNSITNSVPNVSPTACMAMPG